MNKKFFAALMASGMLMGSPMGVLAAEEMVEVEAGAVGGTTVDQASEVKYDDVNFPDDNFRKAVGIAYQNVGNTGTAITTTPDAGAMLSTDTLAKITTLGYATTGVSDYDGTSNTPFKDLTGIEYLTGLQSLVLTHSPNLKVADLTDNGELTTVVLAPNAVYTAPSAGGAAATATLNPATSNGASELYSIILPEDTENLEFLAINGASQLTTLDLSGYDSLVKVDLQNNELAQLNVEGCSSLANLNVSGNDLTGLDVSGLKALTTLTAKNNNLYELELPNGKNLTTIDVSDNKLSTIDVSGVKNLFGLDVSSNRLESLDISDNDNLIGLNVDRNHLATLDISESNKLKDLTSSVTSFTMPASSSSTLTLMTGNQYLYANVDDGGIDLASYDENFQAESSNLGWVNNPATGTTLALTNSPIGGTITKAGVFEFGSNIKTDTTSGAPAPTGISYLYGVGNTGTTSVQMKVNIAQANLMNRLYNPNSGEHFYTADLNEKDTLVKLGWQAEGIGWIAPQENYPVDPISAGAAVFRLYNPNAGDHHYTSDSKEKDTLVRAGWNYEGVGWYSGKKHDPAAATPHNYTIEVYREYNPNAKEAGAHNYTTSENENDTLVALGWLDEGIGWWALK